MSIRHIRHQEMGMSSLSADGFGSIFASDRIFVVDKDLCARRRQRHSNPAPDAFARACYQCRTPIQSHIHPVAPLPELGLILAALKTSLASNPTLCNWATL